MTSINKTLLTMAVALPVMASAADKPEVIVPKMGTDVLLLTAMSDNGLYASSVTYGDQETDNPLPAGGVFYEIATGNASEIAMPGYMSKVWDIADNGMCVGEVDGRPGIYDPKTQQWTSFDVPQGWTTGQFMSVTPDGKFAAGLYIDETQFAHTTPMCYDLTTGTRLPMDNLPVVDLAGEDATENAAYGITPDGRYVLCQVSESILAPVSMFAYLYDMQEQTWTPIGYSYDAATKKYECLYPNLHFIDTRILSTDGKWVCGTAYMVFDGGQSEGGNEGNVAYRYNVESKQLDLYDGKADLQVRGRQVTPDGTLLASLPDDDPRPNAVVRRGNFYVTLDQILDQVYGMSLEQYYPETYSGYCVALSADGLTALMRTYDTCYLLKMPESFAEAAAKVDLLANYTASIPEGSTLTKISEVKVTFDRPISVMNMPSQIKLLDENGQQVRAATAFAVSSTNEKVAVITFRTTTLEGGKQYTLDIPADMIWLRDEPSVKAKHIELHYTGRADVAVSPLEVTPADGSTLAQFNPYTDGLSITFDCQVAISESGSCSLYNADDNTLVATFASTAQGNKALFAPLTTYYLYKGSHYKIVIAAGTVTDLSGAGGCEEIVLNYDGAYVRQLSSDDIYIFESSCDNYDKFMFWQTEFNEPGSVAASWSFTAETPWILVSDDNGTDLALCAHSMFAQPAESDDWLITPQLYLPDANIYLAFDAQRYRNDKNDVLKVYVYEDNAVYNYFSNDLCAAFRADGDLIFDEIIPAGATDEGLDGEWTHYVCDLEKYAGKNIYIAFVNNNYDQSALMLNNVQVARNMNFLVTNRTPQSVINQESVKVSGLVSISTELIDFDGIAVRLKDAQGNVIDEVVDDEVFLIFEDTFDFTFDKELPIVPGETSTYLIEIESGENRTSFTYTINDLMFAPTQRVVVEEFSGATCGNCPYGIVALENLEHLYGDKVIPVILRTYENGAYASGVLGYSDFIGLNNVGAPSARINRGNPVFPTVSTPDGIKFVGEGITESDGSQCYLWADAVRDAFDSLAEADIEFTSSFDESTGQIDIDCDVRFALNTEGRSIGVYAVVTEDNLQTLQLNYISASTDPAVGEWGANGAYGSSVVDSWQISDVARFVVNGVAYNGTPMTQSAFLAGEAYQVKLSGTIPDDRLVNWQNANVVVMLIDGATESVINANKARFNTSGIAGIEAEDAVPVYFSLQGVRIDNPQPGTICIKVQGGKATKCLIR